MCFSPLLLRDRIRIFHFQSRPGRASPRVNVIEKEIGRPPSLLVSHTCRSKKKMTRRPDCDIYKHFVSRLVVNPVVKARKHCRLRNWFFPCRAGNPRAQRASLEGGLARHTRPFLHPIRKATTQKPLEPKTQKKKVTVMRHNASKAKHEKLFYIKINISASFWISLFACTQLVLFCFSCFFARSFVNISQ